MAQIDLLACAYYAGLFDGEGSVAATIVLKPRRTLVTHLELSNTYREPLDRLVTLFGGHMYASAASKNEIWIWKIAGRASEEFARSILPFAIIKREQLLLYLEVRRTVGPQGPHVLAGVWEEREQLTAAVKSAKRSHMVANVV